MLQKLNLIAKTIQILPKNKQVLCHLLTNQEDFMKNDEKRIVGIMIVVMLLSSIGTWLSSGYLLWQAIDVNSFGMGIVWFVAWGVVGGIAQSFIAPLISMAIIAVLSIFIGK